MKLITNYKRQRGRILLILYLVMVAFSLAGIRVLNRQVKYGLAYNPVFEFLWSDNLEQNDSDKAGEILKILTEDAGISLKDDELTKVEKISKFVVLNLKSKEGTPSGISYSNFLELWQSIIEGKTNVWCYHFASSYQLFANVLGIPTRTVEISTLGEDGKVLSHTVAESYLKSAKKWVMVDLTYGMVYAKKGERYLDTFEYLSLDKESDSKLAILFTKQNKELGVKDYDETILNDLRDQQKYLNKHSMLNFSLKNHLYLSGKHDLFFRISKKEKGS